MLSQNLLTLSLVLFSLSATNTVVEPALASPLTAPIGRHAPPYLASKLGGHKRAIASWFSRSVSSKSLTKDQEPEVEAVTESQDGSYYGASHGLFPPRDEPEYYGLSHGLLPPRALGSHQTSPHLSARAAPQSMPSGWAYQGCLEESNGQRLLQGFAFSSGQTNRFTCASVCGAMGFEYSGTEYANECWCGNSLVGSGGAQMPESDCSMPCAGDSSQMCGAGYRLSMYRFNGTDAETSTSTSTTSAATGTSTGTAVATGVNATQTASATTSAGGTAIETGTASLTTSANGTAIETGTATATASVTAPAPASTSAPGEKEWFSLGCAVDNYTDVTVRILHGKYFWYQTDLTIDKCIDMCEDAGYTYAGVEWGQECYCGNSLDSTIPFVDDSECAMPCAGDSTEKCGDDFRMGIFHLTTAEECEGDDAPVTSMTSTKPALPTGNMLVTGTTVASTGAVTATNTASRSSSATTLIPVPTGSQQTASISIPSAAPSTMATSVRSALTSARPTATDNLDGPTPTGLVERVSSNIPGSNKVHEIYAHHMVGNTYPYGKADWAKDIAIAKAAGIDGFALNMGSDWWQTARVADAYAAAAEAGGFTMFLSLDMTAMSCGSVLDAATLVALVNTFAKSPAQTLHNGRVLVSTFSGENCAFGRSSVADGWNTMFKNPLKLIGTDIFFVPSIFSDPSTFGSADWMDGELNWNSGWPMSNQPLDTSSDEHYMAALGDKEYMPAISPFFFTHFPTWGWNKNWIYRSDDFLYANRWEQIIAMRDRVKFTEILTWNDYGESSYIAPTAGALPAGSNVWVDDFPHDPLMDVTKYYATAFKTGAYPEITEDKVIFWARPHPKDAHASNDYVGRPDRWNDTDDVVYALIFATADGVATMTSGTNSERYAVKTGLNKIKLAMSPGAVTIKVRRNGVDVVSYDSTGSFTYTNSPSSYNFNYYIGSS